MFFLASILLDPVSLPIVVIPPNRFGLACALQKYAQVEDYLPYSPPWGGHLRGWACQKIYGGCPRTACSPGQP